MDPEPILGTLSMRLEQTLNMSPHINAKRQLPVKSYTYWNVSEVGGNWTKVENAKHYIDSNSRSRFKWWFP